MKVVTTSTIIGWWWCYRMVRESLRVRVGTIQMLALVPVTTMMIQFANCCLVNELLCLPDTNINALTREHKTALDIAEGLSYLKNQQTYELRANELNQPRDELRNTVTQIKNDVHIQLLQTKKNKQKRSSLRLRVLVTRLLHLVGDVLKLLRRPNLKKPPSNALLINMRDNLTVIENAGSS
ncbi:hypothetical protein M8C21_033854 [Ambrosia artemisiifolia]|uniref:Uncharacterized protein n=1 Tax=Ambrosia artemisiifolia TaxID=4212 RepID=A0AAD5CZ73_AMBAR|nr:hypothetical protein M8C21_033854 [Ambrosia artemisiifolia]